MRIARTDWVLTKKIQDLLLTDTQFRDKLAVEMKLGSPAIVASVKSNAGRTVAKSYDGINYIMKITKLKESQIREEVELEYE